MFSLDFNQKDFISLCKCPKLNIVEFSSGFPMRGRREEDFEMLPVDLIEMKFDKLEALETMMENILRRISIIVAFVCAVLWQAARSRLSSSHNFSSIIESHINY